MTRVLGFGVACVLNLESRRAQRDTPGAADSGVCRVTCVRAVNFVERISGSVLNETSRWALLGIPSLPVASDN